MPDTHNEGARRRRRRSGPPRSQGSRPHTTPRAGHAPEPTGFQKLLNVLSFGLLGKPKNAPARPRSQTPAKTGLRTERGDSSRPPREPRPKREHSVVDPGDITGERLYVGNLSYDATESDLFELFQGVGSVRNAEVVVNNRTERSKGFAFVTMGSVEEARRAVQELNGKEFMSRPLQISGAKPIGSGEGRSRDGDGDSNQDQD